MRSSPVRAAVVALTLLLAACGPAGRKPAPSTGGVAVDEARKLEAVVAAFTEARKRVDPYWAYYFGIEEDLPTFGDYPSPEQRERSRRTYEEAYAGLADVHPERLAPRDRRTWALFREDVEVSLRGFDFPNDLLDFTQMGNRALQFLDDTNPELTDFPFDSAAHYEAFLARSGGFPAYVDRQIATLRRGVAAGIVQECGIVDASRKSYAAALAPPDEAHPFWRPMRVMPAAIGADDRARIAAGFRRALAELIVPGYRRLDAFLRDEYRPHCRRALGLGGLPRGDEWYAYAILANTDLPLAAADVHRTGLREVARIRAEMDAIRRAVGFPGSLADFLAAWRRAPANRFRDADEMFAAFGAMRREMDALAPGWFRRRPTSAYEIVSASNPRSAAASYSGPNDTVPYGRLVLNTMNLAAVARDRVPTLSLHEAVPGHHFQIALVFEMKDRLSEYQRKLFGSTAFAEGWALYAERLGREMGVYRTPMQRLGNLNDEMLRAVRLVVDTGIHAYGWSRARARAYMRRHLAHDPDDIAVEVDRYAVWPGQALAYKIGELEIRALRAGAERELGAAFDVREFHDVVLGDGTVSLGVLRAQVDAWLAAKRGAGAAHR
ncbi:MAG: DUF885 domain-containing protein [Deltaproteobacteria bacterium]|nr:DUF885 domain-containing protein [Deltaproteobacteria bacterium]